MCRKGCSLTAAEVRSTLRSGWQHQHEPADSYIDIKKKKRQPYLWRCKKSTQQLPLSVAVHSPSTHHSAPFGFIYNLEFIKTGSAKLSVSVQHLFYQDFGMGAKSPSRTGQLRTSYLVLLCISRELHSGLKCASLYPREKILFNVDSCSSVSL